MAGHIPDPKPGDQRYPEWFRRRAHKGIVRFEERNGRTYARTWPGPFGPARSAAQQKVRDDFAKLAEATKRVWAVDRVGAELIAKGSNYIWRDVLSLGLVGRLGELIRLDGGNIVPVDLQALLDEISDQPGAMLVRAPTQWAVVLNISDGDTLRWNAVDAMPEWQDAPAAGITQLTGDLTAGPGSGSQVATLAHTAVTPGTYTLADITVDAKGRLTAATSGTPPTAIDQLTGDATAGPGGGSQALTLSSTGVSAGSYTLANITVDAKGRITTASDGAAALGAILHPGYVSGERYGPPHVAAFGNNVMAINRLTATPWIVYKPVVFNEANCNVSTLATAGHMRLAVYSNGAAVPDALILDCGTFATNTTGLKTLTGFTLTLNPGVYWIVTWLDVQPTMTVTPVPDRAVGSLLSTTVPSGTSEDNFSYFRALTYSAGAFPNPFGSGAYSTSVYNARVVFRVQ